MNLVFLLLIILILFITSTIKVNIEEFELYNINLKNEKLNYKIYIELYLFGIIKIIKLKLKNKYINNNKLPKNKKNIKLFFDNKIVLENIKLKISLGTKSIQLTTAFVFILNTIISIILSQKIKEYDNNKYFYSTLPIYNNNDVLQISLNSIISIKLVHIIYIIYSLIKESGEKNGRTSNRKNYAYSHE